MERRDQDYSFHAIRVGWEMDESVMKVDNAAARRLEEKCGYYSG